MAGACALHRDGENLTPLLWEKVVLGAPALIWVPVHAEFWPHGPGVCPLPLTALAHDGSGDPLFASLIAYRMTNGGKLNDREIEEIAWRLQPGLRRFDGTPAWTTGASPAPMNTPRIGWQPKVIGGRPPEIVRAIAVAVEVDLYGLSTRHAFVRHRLAWEGGKLPKEAYESLNAGRALLCHIGVWPWTHAQSDGKLAAGWQSAPAVLEPLSMWAEEARTALRREADA